MSIGEMSLLDCRAIQLRAQYILLLAIRCSEITTSIEKTYSVEDLYVVVSIYRTEPYVGLRVLYP